MIIKLVGAVKVAPQDDDTIHELGLTWYRFEEFPEISAIPAHGPVVRPAVWIKFSEVEQLERIQGAYPEARLGPAGSFNEALIFAESREKGEELEKKVMRLLQGDKEVDDMEAMLREDTMEDY